MRSLIDSLCSSVVLWSGDRYFPISQECRASESRERWGLGMICCPSYESLLGIILVLGAGGVSEDHCLHRWRSISVEMKLMSSLLAPHWSEK